MPKYRSLLNAAFFLTVAFAPVSALAQSAFDDPGSRVAGGAGGGDLKPVADKIEAGAVSLGSSAQVVVLFRNDDSKPLKTGAINLYPSSNITAAIGENQCAAEAVQPAEVCAISLEVKGLQSGNYRIEMLMRHEGRARLLTTTINGTVDKTTDSGTDLISDIEAIPTEIDFGSLDESRSQAKAVILRNKTSKPIDIEGIDIEAGLQSGFSVTSNCKTIKTGAACVAVVRWEPQQKGPSSGSLIVHHSGATEISTVNLQGTYDPSQTAIAELFPESVPGKGLLVSSQEDVDFGSGVAQSSSITTSLVNVGDVPLTLTDIRMANAENGVRVERSGCMSGLSLGPLEACPLTLTWEPVREGSIVDDIQVSHTGARGILVMPIRGAATRAINKDAKAITLGGNAPAMRSGLQNIPRLSVEDIADDEDMAAAAEDEAGTASEAKKTTSKKPAKSSTPSSPASDSAEEEYSAERYMPEVNVRGVLDGYVITSYSSNRAIVAGPGGSRVVFNGEEAVIGGILWEITMRPSAIEFKNGSQKVLLLFDRSLSSFNVLDAQSNSGNASLNNSSSSSSSTTSTSGTSSTQ